MDVKATLDRFLLELQRKNPATVSNLKKIAAFFLSDDRVGRVITPSMVMDYVISRRSSLATPATINRELTIMKQFFRWARLMGYAD